MCYVYPLVPRSRLYALNPDSTLTQSRNLGTAGFVLGDGARWGAPPQPTKSFIPWPLCCLCSSYSTTSLLMFLSRGSQELLVRSRITKGPGVLSYIDRSSVDVSPPEPMQRSEMWR
jgi:hypothetical protein